MHDSGSDDNRQLNFHQFSKWLHGICIVNFDVDIGQTVEFIYPLNCKLSENEKFSVSYLSFPDSHSSCIGNTQHHFRFHCSSVESLYSQHFLIYYRLFLQSLLPNVDTCFGYAYFRQEKNPSLKRNYSQKSVVLLSLLPFDALFYEVAKSIAISYFNHGEQDIIKACEEIDKWPSPKAGELLTLQLLQNMYSIKIPLAVGVSSAYPVSPIPKLLTTINENVHCFESTSDHQSVTEDSLCKTGSPSLALPNDIFSTSPDDKFEDSYNILPNRIEICRQQEEIPIVLENRDFVKTFAPVLSHLQRLWELVLTAKPLLVMGCNPAETSQTVQALVSCISPLTFAADYRPFFTIHDPEFKDVTEPSPHSITILGVTNPFFSKFIHHWPNFIRLGKLQNVGGKKTLHKPITGVFSDELKPGLYSQYKPFLKRNRVFCKQLKQVLHNRSSNFEISRMIQRFFQELTLSFIIPLEHYLSSLMPLQRDISPYRGVPVLNCFRMEDFFTTLETSGPQLTCNTKGDWVGIYKSFFSGPHFVSWLSQRESEIRAKLHSLHLTLITKGDFEFWRQGRSEIEVIDMIINLNKQITSAKLLESSDSKIIVAAIRKHISDLLVALPEDLRILVEQSNSGTGAAFST